MNSEPMATSIRRTSLALLGLLLALAIHTGYWQVARSSSLTTRDDNPRLVLAEQHIPRGAILDRNGQPLAASQSTSDGYTRYYPERAAEPVVGYYSLRYGAGGIEATFDDELRGIAGRTWLDGFRDSLLHRAPQGRPARLTLDLSVQKAADAALANRVGAVVVLSIPEGEVMALASRPTFDPAALDDNWEQLRTDPSSPLLNRATQSAYQPGAAFQTIVLAEALMRGAARLTDTVSAAQAAVTVGDSTLTCATDPTDNTLAAAFAAACPAPFAALAARFDTASAAAMVHQWGFDAALDHFELPAHTSPFTPGLLTSTQTVRALVLGQGPLTLSPLQMASALGTIVNDGRPIPPPHLTFRAITAQPAPAILSSDIAHAIRSALPAYGDLVGQTALAIGGENNLAWFVGFAPINSPRWVIVVVLENESAAATYQAAAQTRAKLTP